jgi:hypothetical protein
MKLGRAVAVAVLAILIHPLVTAFPADDFAKWWPGFQAAVAKSNAKAIAQETRFPLSWENGPIREIKTEAEFMKGFDTYFTAEIRKAIATGKPDRLPDGTYTVTWKARGNEYSLYFKTQGSGFILDALSEGPA